MHVCSCFCACAMGAYGLWGPSVALTRSGKHEGIRNSSSSASALFFSRGKEMPGETWKAVGKLLKMAT